MKGGLNVREKECYRDLIERIDRAYPGREFLTKQEAAAFIGCHPRTLTRNYEKYFKPGLGISKTQLAHLLA